MICKAWVQVFIAVVVGRLPSEPEFWKCKEEWAPQKQWLGSFPGRGHSVGKRQERWGVLSWCLPEEPVLTAAGMRAGSCSSGGERKPHLSPLPLTWLGQPLGVAPGTKSGGEGGRGTGGK